MSDNTQQGAADRLAITYAFPPYADTSAVVAAKRIRASDRPVDLIQNRMDEIRRTDPSSDRIAGPLLRRREVLPTLARFGSWRSVVEFCDAGIEVIRSWQSEQGRYGSMYSRAHFIASHFLAARYKARSPQTWWTAEFSDPLSRNGLGKMRSSTVRPGPLLEELHAAVRQYGGTVPDSDNVYVLGEYATLSLADELVFTNANQRDFVLGLYSPSDPVIVRARARARVSGHPTPPANLYRAWPSGYAMDGEVTNIGYFGNFYAAQHPGAVLRACADLAAEDRGHVQLHLFTGSVEQLQELVAEVDVSDVVHIRHRLPYLEFLNLAGRMDVLLAVDARIQPGQDRNPVLLSKWSDYRGSGTPVWGVTEPGSALDGADLAWRSPLGHRTAALQVLTQLARRR